MRKYLLIAALLSLTGCDYSPEAPQVTECFEMMPEDSTTMPIMVNKCTGETWMLNRMSFIDENGKRTGGFTFKWNLLATNAEEPVLY